MPFTTYGIISSTNKIVSTSNCIAYLHVNKNILQETFIKLKTRDLNHIYSRLVMLKEIEKPLNNGKFEMLFVLSNYGGLVEFSPGKPIIARVDEYDDLDRDLKQYPDIRRTSKIVILGEMDEENLKKSLTLSI